MVAFIFLFIYGFVRNPRGFPLCCYALAGGPNMADILRAFRAKYHLWRSDWLKLLGWLSVRNRPETADFSVGVSVGTDYFFD